MQIFHRSRSSVAALFLALASIVVAVPATARTQEANFIRINTETAADKPAGVRGDLLLANDGNIYFSSSRGGIGYGAIGKLATNGTITTLYSFPDTNDTPVQPFDGVIQASNGDLYGTTYLGGTKGGGTVFRLSLSGQFTLLHSFGENSTDASLPYTGLVQAADGNLYGTTLRGGNKKLGTIFRIGLDGTNFAIIHHFNGDDGESPEGRLIVGSDGALYGTTMLGGASSRGTIYRITLAGDFTSIYSFPSLSKFNDIGVAVNTTGANPRAGLMLAADGNYYGTAYQGGPSGYGTVFRMTPAGAVSVLHAFQGATLGGGFPLARVMQDPAGNFYGTSQLGGYQDGGTAWLINSSGQFTLLHGFIDLGQDGSAPMSPLLLVGGVLYGASSTDSGVSKGTLFKLDRGSAGVLPVELSVSPTEITVGSNATITWGSPSAASCTSAGAWTNDSATSGTKQVAPLLAGYYIYAISCTDGAGVVRTAHTALAVKTPALEPVDGGGGTGAVSALLLLLLAALLTTKYFKETASPCP